MTKRKRIPRSDKGLKKGSNPKHSEFMSNYYKNDENRKKTSIATKEGMTEEVIKKIKNKSLSIETKEKISESLQQTFREGRIVWNKGKILVEKPYDKKPSPSIWKVIRERILKRDEYCCVDCGAKENLQVHHLIPLRLSGCNDDFNLITLCDKCHRIWDTTFIRELEKSHSFEYWDLREKEK